VSSPAGRLESPSPRPSPALGQREKVGAGDAEISFEWPVDLRLTVMSHGWAQLAPWQWDRGRSILARTERVDGRIGVVAAEQRTPQSLTVAWEGFADDDIPEIVRRVRRWVSAEWDPASAVAALRAELPEEAALIELGGGRILRCSNFYEDFVKTVLTINTSWSATLRTSAALVAEPGGGAFPSPEAVLDYGEARLRERAKLGFRAPTVIAATRRMLDDGLIDRHGNGDEGRLGHDYLTSLKGIGPYAAAHCGLLLHDFSRIPIDTVAVADLRERFGQDPAEFLAGRAQWGAYLALGYKLSRLRAKLAGGE
jgi:3-methyladenine DNA glycosylase/8-oxoguanine DNA glycosylase